MSAKINNTNIHIKSIVPRVSKKLSVQRPPGLNSDAIEGLGSQGAELQIELQSDTLAEKHTVTAEFLKTGPQSLIDPDGFLYNIVESSATGGRNYTNERSDDVRWLYGFQCLMEEPYKYLSTLIEREKTITTNGEEWITDDSANPLTTAGTVDVTPDIKVVSGALGDDFEREGLSEQDYDATSYNADPSGVNITKTFSAVPGKSWRLDPGSYFSQSATLSSTVNIYAQATSYNGGVEKLIYTLLVNDGAPTKHEYSPSEDVVSGENEDLNIRYTQSSNINANLSKLTTNVTQLLQAVTKDLTIYNTADNTRKTQICNEIAPGTTITINKNGTGSYNYPEDFTTDTYKYVSYDYNDLTYDSVNDRLWFAKVEFSQSIAAQDSITTGIAFNSDGSKMYEIGTGSDLISESNLGTNWDISSAVFSQSIAAQEDFITGIAFNTDGSKLYEIGIVGGKIYESNLGTNWDISSAVFSQSIAAQDSDPQDITFNSDGSKMYEIGSGSDQIYEYNLGTNWDISTAVFSQSVNTQDFAPRGLAFNSDGSKLYEVGGGNIYESDLSTPYDVSTSAFLLSFAAQYIGSAGIAFSSDGSKLYEVGNGLIYESTFDVSSSYIVYYIDGRYPITGIPSLSLGIRSGPVKMAIAENVDGAPGTYYDIDGLTSEHYLSETVSFLLDNIINYRLKGETSFFLKIYTYGTTDLVLNSLEFDANIVTIDTLLPKVYLGSSNTFRADQNSDSSLNATVTLSYRDGHWVI